jgi:hypothetical protein
VALEHLLNADFDLSLRPRWQPPAGPTARRRITDLAWHGLFLAGPDDSVLVPEPAPDDFIAFLDAVGIAAPRLTVEPSWRADCRLSPFGWNADAARRNRRTSEPVEHPPLDVVARVNGRRYQVELEAELGGSDHTVAVIENEDELQPLFRGLPAIGSGWVIKAEHGNAGLGNRRLRSNRVAVADLEVIRQWLDEDDAVVVERWRPRRRDLAATFTVGSAGGITDFELHETVMTADGALIGALFEADPGPLERWRQDMRDAADAVASRLATASYHGPVCLDAMVWNDGGRSALRPVVDLNARQAMSAGAAELWRRLGARGAALWRFFSRRKLDLPESYDAIGQRLGDDAFDPERRTGALVTAPLWLGPRRRAPAKAAVLLLGPNRDAVLALDRRVRARLER